MSNANIEPGTRINYRGDYANAPSLGVVTLVSGYYFSALLDDGRVISSQPIALLSTPRWNVVSK